MVFHWEKQIYQNLLFPFRGIGSTDRQLNTKFKKETGK